MDTNTTSEIITNPEAMRGVVAAVAAACGAISFGTWILMLLRPPERAAAKAVETAAEALKAAAGPQEGELPLAASPDIITGVAQALSSLVESLNKAGPALWSLIGSILFLLVAAVSAGATQGDEPSATTQQGGGAEGIPGGVKNENLTVTPH